MTESSQKNIAPVLALVGMSNIGKTHWARRLASAHGYEALGCDAMIAARLQGELPRADLRGLAEWMGQPYDARYAETSRRYLAYEEEALAQALATVEGNPGRPYVIDTTGSVVYLPAALLQRLRARARVIYFESSPAHLDDLFRRFGKSPKPVIWDGVYAPRDGETPRQALKRCYGDLLAARALRYRALAHAAIPYRAHRARDADIGGYLTEGRS